MGWVIRTYAKSTDELFTEQLVDRLSKASAHYIGQGMGLIHFLEYDDKPMTANYGALPKSGT